MNEKTPKTAAKTTPVPMPIPRNDAPIEPLTPTLPPEMAAQMAQMQQMIESQQKLIEGLTDQVKNSAPQEPRHLPIPKSFLDEKELNAEIPTVTIKVNGTYTTRGEHRKEVIVKDFEDVSIEVPFNFNIGHVKLCTNRHVRQTLKGIRIREFHYDKQQKPSPTNKKRAVKYFMSDRGLRDNERMKKSYMREIERRKLEADQLAQGILPSGALDDTEYGADGLAPVTENHQYVTE